MNAPHSPAPPPDIGAIDDFGVSRHFEVDVESSPRATWGDVVQMKGERIVEVDGGSALMTEVFRLRCEVFVVEQGVPFELELDEFDDSATHLVAICDEEVVGTLRILEHEGAAKIGRVAVRAASRRTGIGARLMDRAAAIALNRGFVEIVLHAQVSVSGFYRRLGYVEEGDLFDEAGIPHVSMRKKIV
jgi:predicted GNAT family N-acyltransferase